MVVTADRGTATEAEKDTPLYRKNLQQVTGVKFTPAATDRDRNITPLVTFVQKQE